MTFSGPLAGSLVSSLSSDLTSFGGFNPASDVDTLAWYDAADHQKTIAKSGSAVTGWLDKSRHGNDITQGIGGNQPTWDTETLNGKVVITFDGTDFLTRSTMNGSTSQPITYLIVASLDTVSGGHYFADGTVVTNRNAILASNGGNWWMFAGAGSEPTAPIQTGPQLHRVLFNGASSSWYKDGVEIITGDRGSAAITGLTVGTRYNDQTPLDGYIAEMIIITRALSDADITQYEAYLNNKWGL